MMVKQSLFETSMRNEEEEDHESTSPKFTKEGKSRDAADGGT